MPIATECTTDAVGIFQALPASWKHGRAAVALSNGLKQRVSPITHNQGWRSIERRLIEARGRSSGFDYMRLGLSLSVLFFHSLEFSSKEVQLRCLLLPPLNVWQFSVVPMFFALSGFLVAGSLDRSRSLFGFAVLRTLRIFPALAVDTVFSALVLGLSFTALPWPRYLSMSEFHVYFLNIVGDVHYFLPGVFLDNPTRYVNAQLWTIPYELICYLSLFALTMTGIYRRRTLFLLAAALALAIGAPHSGSMGHLNGRMQVACFLLGAAAHLYRDRIPWDMRLCLLALAAMILAVSTPHLLALLPIPLTYLTVFLGSLNPKKIWPLSTGDYSYGIYLYGFPIMQALIATIPKARIWYVGFVLTVLVTGVFAALSWHLVEKKRIAIKPQVRSLETWILARMGRGVRADGDPTQR
jgi:peptidoglycan/LPS O-acetylase OafA/YrhL